MTKTYYASRLRMCESLSGALHIIPLGEHREITGYVTELDYKLIKEQLERQGKLLEETLTENRKLKDRIAELARAAYEGGA